MSETSIENKPSESDNEMNICQSNEQTNMEAAASDDEVVIVCDQNPIIEIEDTDDESGGTSNNNQTFLSAPKVLKDQPKIVTSKEKATLAFKQFRKRVFDDDAQRIPIYKDTVEYICNQFEIDFNPGWSLQQIRKIIKDRTQRHKQTPELQIAIAREAHLWCRGLYVTCLPDWFQIYHVITLMSLMSDFNLSKPTYFIKMSKKLTKRTDPEDLNNIGGCEIRFMNIEDCRQVFYDMQGIKCFKNEIAVRVDLGMYYKKFKLSRTKRLLDQIKSFRQQQTVWCPYTDDGIEMHDNDDEPCQLYKFPLLADIQNDFKKRIALEGTVPFEQKRNRSLIRTQNIANIAKTTEEDTEGAQNSKLKAENIIASNSKNHVEKVASNFRNEEEIICSTVVMDKIPKNWSNLLIHNFIKKSTGQKLNLIFRILAENNDHTIKYLVKFPSHKYAVQVCNDLNGIIVCNKKIEVKLEPGYNLDEEQTVNKRKLVSDLSTTNNEPQSKISKAVIAPPARFPQLGDVQNVCEKRIGPEKVPLEQEGNESSVRTETIDNEAETCTFYEDKEGARNSKHVTEKIDAPNLKNVEDATYASNSKIEEKNSCRTVALDKIPDVWGKLLINNFIKNATDQKINFITRVLSENNDHTIKYLVKFPTHQDAVQVCNDLNGIIVYNKKIEVKLEPEYDLDDDGRLFTVKRKLVPNFSPTNNQAQSKISKAEIVPPARPAVESCPGFIQNVAARTPNLNQSKIANAPEGCAMIQAALLYENPSQYNTNNKPEQNSDIELNAQNQRPQVAAVNKTIEQTNVLNHNQNRPSHDCRTNAIEPSQCMVENLGTAPVQENYGQDEHPRIKRDKDDQIDQTPVKQDIVKKEPEQADIEAIQRNSYRKKSDMLIFNNLPVSVSSAALANKLSELGEVLFCELTSTSRAVVRFKHPHDADRCQRLFHHSKVDGQVIEVTLVSN